MASSIFSGASPNDFLADRISQAGALSGQLNARRTEPLIGLRGGEVSRLTFANGQAIDPLNVWTQVGAPTVQGLATGGGFREGYGPFTTADYWQLGAGLDVLDFAGDYSCAIVHFLVSAPASSVVLFSNGSDNVDGFRLGATSGAGYRFATSKAGALVFFDSGTVPPLGINTVCFGRSGGTMLMKQNLNAIGSAASTGQTPATTTPARIGVYPGPTFPWVSGYVLEFYASTQTASDALFTAIANDVKTKLGVTAW